MSCHIKKNSVKFCTGLNSCFDCFQPAFYEAFGLTVIEAMTCGLPTIATCHGGPAEIIVDGVSGLHIDPYHSDKAADILVNFFEKCKVDPSYWDKMSQGGLKRIYEKYAFQFLSCQIVISSVCEPILILLF
jgi:glycosyltransferase involved in cell wall biosynthesis